MRQNQAYDIVDVNVSVPTLMRFIQDTEDKMLNQSPLNYSCYEGDYRKIQVRRYILQKALKDFDVAAPDSD